MNLWITIKRSIYSCVVDYDIRFLALDVVTWEEWSQQQSATTDGVPS